MNVYKLVKSKIKYLCKIFAHFSKHISGLGMKPYYPKYQSNKCSTKIIN